MNKKTPEDRTVIVSDDSLRESSVQGGKIIGEHITIGCFLTGIPFFVIGVYALFSMFFGFGFPTNTAMIILALLGTVIGLLLIIGGYYTYRDKHGKKLVENQ